MKSSVNASVMRKANRSMILDVIRKDGPISRNRIAEKLKMSVPTVLRIVEELKKEDLVREIKDPAVSRGRPQSLIELNTNSYAIVEIDLGGTKLYGTVTDLAGNVLREIYRPHYQKSSEENLTQLIDAIQDLLNTRLVAGQKFRGIGVGVPAVTQYPEGIVKWAPSLQWRDLPLKDILSEKFGLEVFVENDVNLAAMGELWFGGGRNVNDLVCISIGTGIGAGIIMNNTLYRGHRFSAGEIGYLVPGKMFLGRRYDQFGSLEYLAAGGGIAEHAKQIVQERNLDSQYNDITAEVVFSEARLGVDWAKQLVDDMVDYLTISITAVIGILNPEVIILNGGVTRSADMLIEPIKERLIGLVPEIPRIIVSPLGPRAPILGAVMMVMDGTTKPISRNWF